MPKSYRNTSKTSKTPRRPYEKERMEKEIETCGKYGLKTKREVWRVQLTLARIRKAARELLTLDPQDPKRVFEGAALLRRMFKFKLLDPQTENALDYILALNLEKFLDRRLQTLVYEFKLADSIHNSRTRIRHRHIMVNNQMVNVPSFMVTEENEAKIQNHITSCYGGGKPGRWTKNKQGGGDGDEDDE